MKFKLLDVVRATVDVPQLGVCAGSVGTVVEVFDDAYEVEFCDGDGATLAMGPMSEAQIAPAHQRQQVA